MDTPSGRLAASQAAGFPCGGEPLAVDLADTLVTVTEPATDLLADDDRCARWWDLQHDRLPPGWAAPGLEATRALRDAIRAVLDAVIAGSESPGALDAINVAASKAPSVPQLVRVDGDWQLRHEFLVGNPEALSLGLAAASLIEVMTGPAAKRLRRCANPGCSMLFVAEDARRKWCTQNICGNRTRVARHYQRHRRQ